MTHTNDNIVYARRAFSYARHISDGQEKQVKKTNEMYEFEQH